ncbi:hypothetical protein Salmi_Mp001 (mitochondrion) [Salvia miltiorrhiza]|uniref:Uncharacterized protein n=1 Tax=Salvia miltiorrhiza TaxID=226208 RepID=V9P5J1_SALMI|nr:hypothetical protein Salmi_Mp001 [Salvia miltiorrhiza]AGU16537.1 hypothetical protein Salmi_Mp001 [Salvia miltiorrhiza]
MLGICASIHILSWFLLYAFIVCPLKVECLHAKNTHTDTHCESCPTVRTAPPGLKRFATALATSFSLSCRVRFCPRLHGAPFSLFSYVSFFPNSLFPLINLHPTHSMRGPLGTSYFLLYIVCPHSIILVQ